MSSSLDCLDLCRLCLIKDRVSVPIFEDEGDVRQIFLKITACLPVKVSRDDKLPKKICDDCVYKVELFYQFWNTTANAEKQLLQWLGEVDLEDKQTYVTEVLDTNVMKQEQNSDNRLEGNVIQVSGHQNNMDIGMIEDMTIMTIPAGSEQQFTTVPMDTSGTVQTVQAVPGPSTHDQMGQSQTHLVTEEVEESEEEENSDDGCDNEGLPVKEETEEVQTETFVNVPISCDEAGPSGLQQQKVTEMSEMSMTQTATDGDPKTGVIRLPAGKTEHYCPLCLVGFKRVSLLAKHLCDDHGIEKPFECEICGAAYSDPKMVVRHARLRHGEKKFTCDLCGYATQQKSNLDVHIRRHARNYSYICDVCNKGYMQRSKYLEHKNLHIHGAAHECQICERVFNYKRNLIAHIKTSHPESFNELTTVECSVCPRTFANEYSLRRHMKSAHSNLSESEKKNYLCDLCGVKLASATSLTQHKRLHTGEKVAECDVCGKGFAKAENLKVHQRTHTGEKPYLCSICGKDFTQRTSLIYHLRGHSGERNYECEYCGKDYVSHTGLRKHIRKVHETILEEIVENPCEETITIN